MESEVQHQLVSAAILTSGVQSICDAEKVYGRHR